MYHIYVILGYDHIHLVHLRLFKLTVTILRNNHIYIPIYNSCRFMDAIKYISYTYVCLS